MHAFFDEAVLGYGLLLELSFRAADSVEALGPENTGDLAWKHMLSCVDATKRLARILPYMVTDEADQQGSECRCPCPTCDLGVCGCPLAFRRRMDMAWAETGPIEQWPGLSVVLPRSGSPARQAGLTKGDVLVSVDGEIVDSIPMLQEAIKSHEPGSRIRFKVKTPPGEARAVIVLRGRRG